MARSVVIRMTICDSDQIDRTVPQAENIGLTLPDPDLKWNAHPALWLRHHQLGRILPGHQRAVSANARRLESAGEEAPRRRPLGRKPRTHMPAKKSEKRNYWPPGPDRLPTTQPEMEKIIGRYGKSSPRRSPVCAFEHAGSLHAPDKEMALMNARDVYSRRNKSDLYLGGTGESITSVLRLIWAPSSIPRTTRPIVARNFTKHPAPVSTDR